MSTSGARDAIAEPLVSASPPGSAATAPRRWAWLLIALAEKAELRFFRDGAGHEVDAVVLCQGAPWMAVEVEFEDRPLDRGLRYLLLRTVSSPSTRTPSNVPCSTRSP